VIGICVGILALIRLNNLAPIVGFVLWFYILLLRDGSWRRVIISALLMIAGVIIVFIPSILFYYIKEGWYGVSEMLYGTFGFNFHYIADHENWKILQWLQYYIPIFGFVIITLLCVTKQNRNITIPLLISYVITVFSFGHRMFYHYIIIFIPLFLVSLCLLYRSHNKIAYTLLGIVFMQCFLDGYSALDCLAHRFIGDSPNSELNDGFHQFVFSIPKNEKNSIYNAGLNHMGAGLFADENIYQCNRFVSYSHVLSSQRLSKYEQSHGLDVIKPVWVLTQGADPSTDNIYLLHYYKVIDSIPGGEFDPIWCWKKKID
ncbi:MAG: hypothetical protein Q4D29_12695, partial [Lachnospiraceae bacterium]|nr:hypothetical protein [Lachnospiraceae bacterium]